MRVGYMSAMGLVSILICYIFPARCGQATAKDAGSNLHQLAELTASDSGGATDGFGSSVAISGNTAVVGAPQAHNGAGAAYVFVKPQNGWTSMTQTAELTPSDSVPGINFGSSVAISGSNIVVGSFAHNAAYVFTRPQGGWKDMTQTAILSADRDGVPDLFGFNVAIDGATIAVSAYQASFSRGRVDVFVEPAGGWVNAQSTGHLSASDTTVNSFFGAGLAMSGSAIVVGAFGNSNDRGSAYVFVRPSTGWKGSHTQTAELTATDGASLDFFGDGLAIRGNTIAVGASGKNNNTGAAYVYVEPATGWVNMTQTAELTASDGAPSAFLGSGMAVIPNLVVAGAQSNGGAGAVYAYVKPPSGWQNSTQTDKVTAPGSGELGSSDGVVGSTILSGARNSSTAYIFGP